MPFKDKEKTREYQKEWSRNHRAKIRIKAIEILGGKCVECGYDANYIALQIDHKDPVLRIKNHRIYESGNMTLKHIVNSTINIDSVQLLCANCHAIKSFGDRLKYKNYDKPKRRK